VGSEDFKSSCRALDTSGVGSIPTRSRQSFSRRRVGWLGAAVLLAVSAGWPAGARGAVAAPSESPEGAAAAAPADSAAPGARPAAAPPDSARVPAFRGTWRPLEAREGSALDSAATRPRAGSLDSTRVRPVRVVGSRVPGVLPKAPAIWWVTVRSGILPGWGQLANGKPLKAILLGGIYGYFAAGALAAESDRKSAREKLAGGTDATLVAAVNSAVERRNGKMWMMGATMLYAMLDAYVDAHFFKYDDEWRVGLVPGPDEGPALALTRTF
jgi:hypothetical protein